MESREVVAQLPTAAARTNADESKTNADNAVYKTKSSLRVCLDVVRVRPRSRFFILAGLTLALGCGERDDLHGGGDAPKVVQVPDGARIRVEIINTTNQRGLARRAMFFLRDQGFDVVRYASGSPPRDSSEVVDRSGNPEWAELVAQSLGVPRVLVDIDSARYLDVSVYLGRDWRPPAKPFYP